MSDCAGALTYPLVHDTARPSSLNKAPRKPALKPASSATISNIQERRRRFTVRLTDKRRRPTLMEPWSFRWEMFRSVNRRIRKWSGRPPYIRLRRHIGGPSWMRRKTGLCIAPLGPVEPAAAIEGKGLDASANQRITSRAMCVGGVMCFVERTTCGPFGASRTRRIP